ncbi:hypothetical protein LIER_13376 [Lithospermum erythrorhizon]|uniref:Retrovirus-related Pol polyprotein from transposon TNT 1-94-like beta-barrel domain-containing protein n=1 Tax=Lithospermum erythrorhizon TaxID=34254 RepID=A0AAV3PV70_LITER
MEEKDDMLVMAQSDQVCANKDETWFMSIDSGCSNHMCKSEELFSCLDKSYKHSVKLGNNTKLSVTGKSIVKLKFNNVTYAIGDVYFVPELKSNLLSVGQLQEKGLIIIFKGGNCIDMHPTRGEIIQTSMKANRMFMITLEVQKYSETEEKCANYHKGHDIWIKRILEETEHEVESCICIKCDNSSTIKLSKNPVLHSRSKHIDVRFHFLRNLTKEGSIALEFFRTSQVADILTKPLKSDAFIKLRSARGMCSVGIS